MSDDQQGCDLYLITPEQIPDVAEFSSLLDEVLATGYVACLQLRLKDVDDAVFEQVARKLLPVCHEHEVPLLINDRADIAASVGADGVHLGQDDGDLASARTLLGSDKDIGVTCHGSKHLAYEAGEAGANYVAFGAFFPSRTKPDAQLAEKIVLTDWDMFTDVPCVAIGGVTPDNCRELADAGAHFVAVCGAVWGYAGGPVAAVRAFHQALSL